MTRPATASRVRAVNDAPVRGDGRFVLYWMIAARRVRFSFALQHAVARAEELGLPLVILEALRCDYPWASDRLHRFILDGMAETATRLEGLPVTYHPWVEAEPGAGRGLLETLAGDAAVVVTDEYPTFFLPRMVHAAGEKLPVRLEAVDGNGLMPLAETERDYPTAHAFRRFLQRRLPAHLDRLPAEDPLADAGLPPLISLPAAISERWPAADLEGLAAGLDRLPLDHAVPPTSDRGGAAEAEARLERFLDDGLERYADEQSQPSAHATSRLSPYLHFGHISAHEIFLGVMERQRWSPDRLGSATDGRRRGWWNVSASAEAFLDQLVTWRELGHIFCWHRPDHLEYESLPDWALKTLAEHAGDERPHLYSLEQLRDAATHDALWNAAQRQLLREGHIHNYMRMLWGKKILHWTSEPREALEIMLELNDRFALDGRDPNSYSGIFWILGRHDRAWGPERPVFGKVRYMTSDNTRRKLDVKAYLQHYSEEG